MMAESPHSLTLDGLVAAIDAIGPQQGEIEAAAEAIAKFGAALAEAKASWSGSPATQRLAIVKALAAVVDLVDTVADFRKDHLDAPIVALQMALLRLDHNHIAPILQPTVLPTVKIDDITAMMKGRVAAACQLLMDAGESDAAGKIARELEKLGICKPKGGRGDNARITPATVKNWRKEAREQAPSHPVRERYESMLRQVAEQGIEPGTAARNILLNLGKRTPKPKK